MAGMHGTKTSQYLFFPILIKSLVLITLSLFLISCTKEEFSANKSENNFSAPLTFSNASNVCAKYTLIKPKVDFLFLWDNTSSQIFITPETKSALSNTINLIADRFDFHIMMAPLVLNTGDSVNSNSFLITSSTYELGQTALNILVPKEQASTVLNNFTTSSNSDEKGMKRSVDLVSGNVSNGIFRQDAYTIIVLMSNGNDTVKDENGVTVGSLTTNNIITQKNALVNLRNNTLNSLQMRFISLVVHTDSCKPFWRSGTSYTELSKQLYSSPFPGGDSRKMPSDQTGDPTPDSYDICSSDFLHLFDGVNNSIIDTVISHKYNFWPISAIESPITFDPNKIKVQKNNGDEFFEIPEGSTDSGWRYVGYKVDQPTRFSPTPGENFTGHVIELFGNAQITHPECLIVTTESPVYNYGYFALNSKPLVSSIRVTINGANIPQSTTDGWEFIGFKDALNLRIQGPNFPQDPYQEALPADMRTNAYFLKMHGSAMYKSGDKVNAVYDPSGN